MGPQHDHRDHWSWKSWWVAAALRGPVALPPGTPALSAPPRPTRGGWATHSSVRPPSESTWVQPPARPEAHRRVGAGALPGRPAPQKPQEDKGWTPVCGQPARPRPHRQRPIRPTLPSRTAGQGPTPQIPQWARSLLLTCSLNSSSAMSVRLTSTLKYAPNTPISRALAATCNSHRGGAGQHDGVDRASHGAHPPCPGRGHGPGPSCPLGKDGKWRPQVPTA